MLYRGREISPLKQERAVTAVYQVHQWLQEAESSSEKPLDLEYSPPWSWIKARSGEGPNYVPNHQRQGIYLLSEPDETDWQQPLEDNPNPVWYVGQTTSKNFQARVYDHLSGPGGVATDQVWPGWKEWEGDERIREVMLRGQAVVYTIPAQFEDWDEDLPLVLEKYLLSRIYFRDGDFPPLNQTIKS